MRRNNLLLFLSISFLLIIVMSVLFHPFIFSDGILNWGDQSVIANPERSLSILKSAWNEYFNMGTPNIDTIHFIFLPGLSVFQTFINFLMVNTLGKIFILTITLIAFWAMFYLSQYIFEYYYGRKSIGLQITAGLMFTFSAPILWRIADAHLYYAFAVAIFPALMLQYLKLRSGKNNQREYFKNALLLGVLGGILIQLAAQWFVIFCSIIFFDLFLLFVKQRRNFFRENIILLKYLSLFSLLSLGISMNHWLPVIIFPEDIFTEFKISMSHPQDLAGAKYSMFFKAIRLGANDAIGWFYLFIAISILFLKRDKLIYFLLAFFFFGIFLSKGSYPPFGIINYKLINSFSFLRVFRDSEKFNVLALLPISLLTAIYIDILYLKYKKGINGTKKLAYITYFMVFMGLIGGYITRTFILTEKYNRRLEFPKVPEYLKRLDIVLKDKKDNGRVLVFPSSLMGGSMLIYNWTPNLMQALFTFPRSFFYLPKPVSNSFGVPLTYSSAFSGYAESNISKNLDLAIDLLKKNNTNYLITDGNIKDGRGHKRLGDILRPENLTFIKNDISRINDLFSNNPNFNQIIINNDVSIFEIRNNSDSLFNAYNKAFLVVGDLKIYEGLYGLDKSAIDLPFIFSNQLSKNKIEKLLINNNVIPLFFKTTMLDLIADLLKIKFSLKNMKDLENQSRNSNFQLFWPWIWRTTLEEGFNFEKGGPMAGPVGTGEKARFSWKFNVNSTKKEEKRVVILLKLLRLNKSDLMKVAFDWDRFPEERYNVFQDMGTFEIFLNNKKIKTVYPDLSQKDYKSVMTNNDTFINIGGKNLVRKANEYYISNQYHIDFDRDLGTGIIDIKNFELDTLVHNGQWVLSTNEPFTGESEIVIPVKTEDVTKIKNFMVYMDMLFIVNGGDSAEIQISKDQLDWKTLARTSWDSGGDLHPMKADITNYLTNSTIYLKFKMHDGSPNDRNYLTKIWFTWSYKDIKDMNKYVYKKNGFHKAELLNKIESQQTYRNMHQTTWINIGSYKIEEGKNRNTISISTLGDGNVIIDDIVVVDKEYFDRIAENLDSVLSERDYYVITDRDSLVNIGNKNIDRKSNQYHIDFDRDLGTGIIDIKNFELDTLVHNGQWVLSTNEPFTGESEIVIPVKTEDVTKIKNFMVYMDMLFIVNGGDSAEIQISKDQLDWKTLARTSWDSGGDLHPMKADITNYLTNSTIYLKFKMHDGSPNDRNYLTKIWFTWSYKDIKDMNKYVYKKNGFHKAEILNNDRKTIIINDNIIEKKLHYQKENPSSYYIFINDKEIKEIPDNFFMVFKSTYSPYWVVKGDVAVVDHIHGDYFNNTFLIDKRGNKKEGNDLVLNIRYIPERIYIATIAFSTALLLVTICIILFMKISDFKKHKK